ncbi:MAG: helix-turn-helix domain-containing protein [Butyricicoccaceae bacterium]
MKIYDFEGCANIVGPRVKELRRKQKLSQDELAARLQLRNIGISQKGISRIEKQERFVADFELAALADSLHVDVRWLLGKETTEE